jgi:hypothetical protein
VVFNPVGSACFDLANRCMALNAHQVFIATTDRAAPFDILAFHRAQHSCHGIDSLALDDVLRACRSVVAGSRQRLVVEPWREGARRKLPGHLN